MKLYVRSLEFFMAGLKYSKNEKTNAIIRTKAKEYMARAERIRAALDSAAASEASKHKAAPPTQTQPSAAAEPAAASGATGRLAGRQADEALRSALGDTLLLDKPNLAWDDVAGLDQARKTLEEAVLLPQKFPQMFVGKRKAWKGILLYGPPGTGKSYLAKVIASVSNASFFSVSSADLVSKYFGQSEKLVRELFVMAMEKKPAIIFIDEIDAICGKRSEGQQDSTLRMQTEFLTCMTDIAEAEGVLVMAATNRPFDLDPAVRRRFEKRIYIPLPNEQARAQLFKIHSNEDGVHLSEQEFQRLAHRTDGFSGSDIQNTCRDALMQPVRECLRAQYWRPVEVEDAQGRVSLRYVPCADPDVEGAERLDMMQLSPESLVVPDVGLAYFEQTLATIKPSVGREDLKMYEDYTRMFGMEGTTAGLEEEEEDDDEVIIVSAPGKGKEKLVEMEVDAPPASSTKRRRTGGARSAAPRRPVVAV